jgi:pectinesterase inhibitor-like protein
MNMNSRATVVLVLVPILASAASLFTITNACEGVPSVPIEAACRKASGREHDEAMYKLCSETLNSMPDNKISTYAAAAADKAAQSSNSTVGSIKAMLDEGSIEKSHVSMWSGCVADYQKAHQAMTTVKDQVQRCSFADIKKEFMDARVAFEHCEKMLVTVGPKPEQLHNSVANSRKRIGLAFRLAHPLWHHHHMH